MSMDHLKMNIILNLMMTMVIRTKKEGGNVEERRTKKGRVQRKCTKR